MDRGNRGARLMSSNDRRDHVDAASPEESLWDALRKHGRNLELQLHVAAPGTIVSYDASTQQAEVTLGFRAVPLEEDGVEAPDPPIKIPGVRVMWPGSSVSYDTHPLVAGDTGLLIFADRALDEWYRKGGAVDPIDARAHSLADAVFLPGLRPDANAITPPTDATARVIHHDALIKLGAAASQFVALADLVKTNLDTLKAAIAAAPTVPLDGGAAFKSSLVAALSAWPSPMASGKVQAE